jgi:hypothetical protein
VQFSQSLTTGFWKIMEIDTGVYGEKVDYYRVVSCDENGVISNSPVCGYCTTNHSSNKIIIVKSVNNGFIKALFRFNVLKAEGKPVRPRHRPQPPEKKSLK